MSLMQRLVDNSRTLPSSDRFYSLVRKLQREGKRFERLAHTLEKDRRKREDRAVLASTRLVQQQSDTPLPQLPAPDARVLHEPEHCYVCKAPYTEVHFFYHFLCPSCAHFNYTMRSLHADLTGRVALVTGGRVKIGHQLVLRLLRDGARVIVTTRFPHAAAQRFSQEADAAEWRDRLRICRLDLRDLPAVEAFCDRMLETEPALDILVHNAAQTIQRAPGFYAELQEQEQHPHALPAAVRELVLDPRLQLGGETVELPALLQPTSASGTLGDLLPGSDFAAHDREERVDSRDTNSWLLPLEAVSTRELLEVQLVNSTAPFVLNARLKSLLERSPHARRFIVNVSAMEGQFSRHKTDFHPHTNMAKAALNMMTHTSAAGYARSGIYMNSVDTGWVTDENPTPKRLRKQDEMGFFAPLDIVDGMARIYHPIALGISDPGPPFSGQFLKDYAPCKW